MTDRLVRTALLITAYFSPCCRAGDLAGKILDNNGAPVSGAIVTASRSSVDGPLRAAESAMTRTQADGAFSFNNLPAGPYVICAISPVRDLLDPCRWNDTQAVVRVPSGSGTVSSIVKLEQGVTLNIRIDDPDNILAPGAAVPVLLSIGIWNHKGHHQQAWQLSSDPSGSNYKLIIPPNLNSNLAVELMNLVVQDTTGKAVDTSKGPPINLPAGQQQQFHYVVRRKP